MRWFKGEAKDAIKNAQQSRDPYYEADPHGDLRRSAAEQGAFGLQGQDRLHYASGQMQSLGEALQAQANGRNLVSTEALRQGLQSNLAGYQGMVGAAAPGNAAMAQRQAMLGAAQGGYGLAGQQANQAMQERAAAQRMQAGLYGQIAQQGTDAALNAGQNQLNAYGQLEDARTRRYGYQLQKPSTQDRILKAGMGGLTLGATVMSDRRLKENISEGDDDADKFLKSLRPYKFKYRDERHGSGAQLGIMAQDLEKTRLGKQAVFETGEGKAVHGGKLATALAAAAANLDRRLSQIESKR